LLCGSLAGAGAALPAAESAAPITLADGLLDPAQTETLGLAYAPGAETFTIFRPGPDDNRYNHGVVLLPFQGRLYAQWQTSKRDEDAPDTHVVYSVSDDGETWSAPRLLAPAMEYGAENGIRSSGGWWSDGATLVAYINEWPAMEGQPKGGRTVYRSSPDGERWSAMHPVTGVDGEPVPGVFEQDPRALPDGRIVSAFHLQPGLQVAPFYTEDPLGVSGWTRGRMQNLPHDNPASSRELEPSWFRRPDGALVMLFRDQANSYRKLASVSRDRGASWTTPALTDVPDSRSKQSAGNLPDGSAFLVGNPTTDRRRYPLAILLSADGRRFDRAWLLRAGGADLQPLRHEGRYKRPGFSYPKSVLWGDYLYVGYATNKEDLELTRVAVEALIRR
jgi:hypothetical protein